MKTKTLLAIVLLILPMSISAQRKTSLETGWKFHRNGVINARCLTVTILLGAP